MPSETVTVPVGLPEPGEVAVTVKDTIYARFTAGEEGEIVDMAVVVLDLFTV